jgi:DNA-binding GntR family transcriptional regulator
VQTNTRFHSIFHTATRTKRLSGMLIALEEAGGVFVAQAQELNPEIRRRAVADHYALLDAFENKDIDAAVAIQLGHLGLPLESYRMNTETD